jgi:hypothetical protein
MTEKSPTQPQFRHQSDDRTKQREIPSQQGSGGGNMSRKVGQRDELKTSEGGDPLPTSVNGRDKADDSDLPTKLQTRR